MGRNRVNGVVFYDPMIAKIIVTAATREQAIQAMCASLANTQVAGIETNLEYLQNIIACDVFALGTQTTRFLNTFEWKTQKLRCCRLAFKLPFKT